jgi:hypothetical protein
VYEDYPYLLAEMYAYSMAAAHEQLPHLQVDNYMVSSSDAGGEAWPIGWKTKTGADKPLAELFEFLNVEIKETSVAEAIAAIQARVKAPFLFDTAALARHGIDPAAVQADVPEKRMTYSQILGKVLMQARLKYELRVDDADKPFLWITTVKPAA